MEKTRSERKTEKKEAKQLKRKPLFKFKKHRINTRMEIKS